MTRSGQRLTPWQRRLLEGCGGILLVTGLAWLVVHYDFGAGADALPAPAEAWLLRLHGLAGFGALFLLGALAAHHIPHGWRLSARHRHARQRGTGLALCTLAGLLAATGYALYYFAPEAVRPALGWIHAALGVGLAGVVLRHRRHPATTPRGPSG